MTFVDIENTLIIHGGIRVLCFRLSLSNSKQKSQGRHFFADIDQTIMRCICVMDIRVLAENFTFHEMCQRKRHAGKKSL